MASLRDQIAAWSLGEAFRPAASVQPNGAAPPAAQAHAASEAAPPAPAQTHTPAPSSPAPALSRAPARELSPGYFTTKIKLHKALLARMDLAAAQSLPEEQVRTQLRNMIDMLIGEEQLPVNEQ